MKKILKFKKYIALICIALILVCIYSIYDQSRINSLPDQVPVYISTDIEKGMDSAKPIAYLDNPEKKGLSPVTVPLSIAWIVVSVGVLAFITIASKNINTKKPVMDQPQPTPSSNETDIKQDDVDPIKASWTKAWDEINKYKPSNPTTTDVFNNLNTDDLMHYLLSTGIKSLHHDENAIIQSERYYDEETLMQMMIDSPQHTFPFPPNNIDILLNYSIDLQDGPLFSVRLNGPGTLLVDRLVCTDESHVYGEHYNLKPDDTFTVTVRHYVFGPSKLY